MAFGNDIIGGGGGGSDPTITTLTEGQVPKANASQKLIYGGATVDPTTLEWTFDQSINVPSGSINVGEVLQLSEGTADLVVVDLLKSSMAFSVNSNFSDSSGSSPPSYFNFGESQALVIQGVDDTIIIANPLNFSLTGTVTAPDVRTVDQVTLRTDGVMTNVRIKVVDNTTGLAVRYIPSKAAFDSGTGGVNLVSGDNTFYLASNAADTPGNIYLGFQPFLIEAGQQLDFTLEADAVDLLGNVGDNPYLTAEVHDGPPTDLADRSLATRAQTTGLLEGGVVTQASGTTVDWTSGAGQVADYSDPENPVITDVTWNAVTGFTITNVASEDGTLICYNAAGSVVEILISAYVANDERENIILGLVTHTGGAIVNVLTAPFNVAYDGIESFNAFMSQIIGPANVGGNIYGANGANLNIDVVGGNAFILGSNFRNDPGQSDIIPLPSESPVSFFRSYRTAGAGASIIFETPPTTLIEPTMWDDGSGTLQIVPAGNWTIQRIFRSRGNVTTVSYGQETFTSRVLAIEALGSESFTEKSPLPYMLYRSSLIVGEGSTDLSDTAQAEFFNQSSFRVTGAQSAASTIPGITSPGGSDTNIQVNDGGVFGGYGNFTYDSANRKVTLKSAVANTTLLQFDNSSDIEKMIFQYDEVADNVFLAAANNVDLILSTGSGAAIGIDNQNPVSTLHILEISTSVDATAGLTIEQDGAGDAVTQYLLTGGQRWVTGIDNSDGDFFKIASSENLDSDAVLTLDTMGHADFSSSVSTLFGGFGSAQNLVKYSQDLANAEWSELGSISVASNNAVAPDGTMTADTLTWTGSAELNQTLSGMSVLTLYQVSFWGRNVSGGADVGIELGGGTTVFQTLTSTWTRYNLAVTSGNSSLDLEIQSLVASSAEIWGVQVADSIEVLSYTRTEADSIDIETTGLVCNGNFLATGTADISGDVSINDPSAADTQELMTYTAGGANGGTSKIYVGSRTPEGNVTADGGALYFRDDGTSSDVYIKRSDASNTGWFDIVESGIRGPSSSIQYAIARFDDTTGNTIDAVGAARLVLTSSHTTLVMGPQASGGNDEIVFTNISNDVVGSVFLDTSTGNLTATVVSGDLILHQQSATDDIDVFLGSDDLLSEFAVFNNSLERIFTVSGDKTVSVPDDVPINFGIGNDLSIMHDGTNSTITNITGDLIIDAIASVIIDSSQVRIGDNGAPVSTLHVYEDTTETSTAAGITIEQDGTGDAMLQYQLTGGQRWTSGIDNTNDRYKIASGNFNNSEALAIDTGHHVALTNSLGTPFGGLGKIQNYLSYSEDFDESIWQKLLTNPPTVVANNAVAPDGSMTADTVTFPGPGSGLLRQGGLTTSTSTAYTITGWVKHVSGGSILSVDIMDGTGGNISADNVWRRYSVNVTSGTTGSYLDIQRGNFGVYEFWGWQISDGSETTPYAKTLDTSLDVIEYGATVNECLRISSREAATVGMEVFTIWTDDDLPNAPAAGIVVLPAGFYDFKNEFSFGTNQVQLENFDFIIFSQSDAFMTSINYEGTLPWFIGQGHLRLAGNGCTIKMTADNATMFDLDGGFGADFSSVVATGANAAMGEIRGQTSGLTDIISARFFSDLSVFSGFKFGITLDSIQFLNITSTNTFLADDAEGAEFNIVGDYDFISFDSVEIQAPNSASSFLNIDPTITTSAIITKCLFNGDGDFFAPGTTGGISIFADASVPAEAVTSVTDNSGTARFNFTAPPTLFVGQKVVMSTFTNYTNEEFTITATGANYYETGAAYNGADTGSFLSNSVTVVTGATPPAELDTVLITDTLSYNLGSVIYNRTVSNFQINAVWDTAETTGTWDTGSLTESSKYVTTSANGEQRDSKQLASVFVSGNVGLTSITGVGTYDPLNLVAASIGQGMENFTLMDAATGEVRYDGVNTFQGAVLVSLSALKSGGAVSYRFRLFKTVGSGVFDAVTVTRGVTTTVGSLPLVTSVTVNPGDQFRVEVEAQSTTNSLTIPDFSMVAE